jgi:hypothetical protein
MNGAWKMEHVRLCRDNRKHRRTYTPVVEENKGIKLLVQWVIGFLEQNSQVQATVSPPKVTVSITIGQILRQCSPSFGGVDAIPGIEELACSIGDVCHAHVSE